MAGICGYWGGEPSLVCPVDSMARSIAGLDVVETRLGEGLATAVAGVDQTALSVEHRGVIAVSYGHPRWVSSTGAPTRGDQVLCDLVDQYRSEGAGVLARLRGDFALAILDRARNTCLLAVDRVGVRNLVYQSTGDLLVFGSTCDAVLAHPGASREVDRQQIYNYVYFHMVPGPRTVYRNLTRVLPGCYVQFENGRLRSAPYWQMQYDHRGTRDQFPQLKKRFLESLAHAVDEAAGTAECGAFLSGGTDSSTISGMLGKARAVPAKTYSIGFAEAGYDEMEYARIAARHFRTEHFEYYVTPADVVSTIPQVAKTYDQPFGNASAIPTYHCARVAKAQGVKRLLAGDGGDELYGGNARYAKQAQLAIYDRVPAVLRRLLIEPMISVLPGGIPLAGKARSYVAQASIPMPQRYEGYNLIERLGAGKVFEDEFLSSVDTAEPHALIADVYSSARAEHWLNRVLAVDLRFTLADNDLPKVTRMCELAGIDVAFPMLDEQVVALSGELAPDMKLKGTQLRYFFKEALRGFLPDEILRKQKHGFGLPVGPWLEATPALNRLAFDALEDLKGRRIIRPAFIDDLLTRYLKEHSGYYGTLVWVLMMLELWFKEHSANC